MDNDICIYIHIMHIMSHSYSPFPLSWFSMLGINHAFDWTAFKFQEWNSFGAQLSPTVNESTPRPSSLAMTGFSIGGLIAEGTD